MHFFVVSDLVQDGERIGEQHDGSLVIVHGRQGRHFFKAVFAWDVVEGGNPGSVSGDCQEGPGLQGLFRLFQGHDFCQLLIRIPGCKHQFFGVDVFCGVVVYFNEIGPSRPGIKKEPLMTTSPGNRVIHSISTVCC